MPRASYSPRAAGLALAVPIDMVEQMAATPDLGDTRTEPIAFVNRAVAFAAP